MIKKMVLLFLLATFSVSCSTSDDEQNLDINVYGKVTNEYDVGIANVTIYIQRGKYGGYVATNFQNYDTVVTNAAGTYSYVIKEYGYNYRLCCGIPTGYTIVEENCKDVNANIIDSKTQPNYIDFKLMYDALE